MSLNSKSRKAQSVVREVCVERL